ncbi:Uncharacterised protein [Lelliottia amnigena]|nr:Uncharacterised protein [Lelliottia amnigena]
MRSALIVLLLLVIITPVTHAADWLSWRKVGDATLTWDPFPSTPRSCAHRMATTRTGAKFRR